MNVSLDKTEVRPGDELEVHVDVIPKKDFYVRQGRVKLVRVETYIDRVHNSKGRDYYSKRTRAKSVVGETFIQDESMLSMRMRSASVKLVLPSDILPTFNGGTVRGYTPGISWKVVVTLDVPKSIDSRTVREVVVLKSSESVDLQSFPVSAEASKKGCSLVLSLSGGDVSSGGTVEGVFYVEASRDTNVSEVRVELVRDERFGDVGKTVSVDELSLQQDVMLCEGRRQEWPFVLNVGQVEVPSLKIDRSSVVWSVKARLDMKMRRDPLVRQEINVHC